LDIGLLLPFVPKRFNAIVQSIATGVWYGPNAIADNTGGKHIEHPWGKRRISHQVAHAIA